MNSRASHSPRRVHARLGRTVALCLAVTLGASACGTGHLDEYNEVQQGNARPADSPPTAAPTEGAVVDVGGPVRSVVAYGPEDGVAVQLSSPPTLLVGSVRGQRWAESRRIELPAGAGVAAAGVDGSVLVPHADGVLVLPASGPERRVRGLGAVTSVAATAGGDLLTGGADGVVTLRSPDGSARHSVPGLQAADQLTVTSDGSVTALSRPDTVIASIDVGADQAGPLLRAGKGAGRQAAFGPSTVVATDTVGGEMLVYATSPVRLHQMFPVARAPWAVAGDLPRHLVWTSSTGENRVQAYDLGSGLGERRFDTSTVRAPESLAVTGSGTVVVGSASGQGLHLLRPPGADRP